MPKIRVLPVAQGLNQFALPEDTCKLISKGSCDFKVIGYFPNWYGDVVDQIRWDKLTHVNYAFAIPTEYAVIKCFDDTAVIHKLITTAHDNNVKVGLSVGGWSYHDVILESIFVEATNTEKKCQTFSESILAIIEKYGFDGVDMDWEYPRAGISTKQYEYFMTLLRQGLARRCKFLSVAVIGCSSIAEGQSDYILNMVDWINVMAYDGDKGAGHSPYELAVKSGEYWINARCVPANKVVMGVPFYERPTGISYADIVTYDVCAALKDSINYCGTTIYYNGLSTIADKTVWACKNAGGIMIWELTQDSKKENLSLLNQISSTINKF